MNIAIVLKTFPPDVIGGMETQTKRMATELHNADHDITVFTKEFDGHDDSDVPYEVIRVRNWNISPFISDLSFLLFALFSIARRSNEFDCLQCMMLYPVGFLGYMVNKLTGLPYFAWVRGGDYYLMNDVWWKRWMMRRVLLNTLVLAQSDGIRADIVDDFNDIDCEIEVLGNAVSVPDEMASGDGVLYIGRLAKKKGLEHLIVAVADLDTRLTLVGDGPELERLEQLARETGANVSFVGAVSPSEVDTYYRSAAVFVLPSLEGEGMPNVILEAMSWGLPVVATDSGGIPTIIENGTTGYVVPMRNPEMIKKRIQELLNSTKSPEMGRAAREYVQKHHSWEQLVGELNTIYKYMKK